MLTQWQHHHDEFPAPAPSPSGYEVELAADATNPMDFAYGAVSFDHNELNIGLHSLPAPWFIYSFMGLGILVCCITCIGHIAAEAINGCCLCSYAMLNTVFVLLEAGLVTFIALDRHWERDLPHDPTGELDSLRTFIEDNVDVFEWVGIAIAVLSVLFAVILRSLVSNQRGDDDIEEDIGTHSRTREPLLDTNSGHASGSTKDDSDSWSSRMRKNGWYLYHLHYFNNCM
ncbi:tetraspanin-18-like [Dorcoceras hygrometricum]|uniref:Tetraspanin-18-like n=1 Tax=Dorcoceras hygrometricum TaxID=472368 RepID=A0A2Z7AQ96_9LAMI|nr:tetraspanin-18-like [Dorcoceras hygrometricum]